MRAWLPTIVNILTVEYIFLALGFAWAKDWGWTVYWVGAVIINIGAVLLKKGTWP